MARENMSSQADLSKSSPFRFEFEDKCLIRAIVDAEGKAWFVGVDVCRILGLANSTEAVALLDEDDRSTLVDADVALGLPSRIIVSAAGVFRLIFTHPSEGAGRFKRWLEREVLPNLRPTGRIRHRCGTTARVNTASLNAAIGAVGEVRRCFGSRVAAETLPAIFAKAGISVPVRTSDQGELDLRPPSNVVNLRPETTNE
jgi:prophage antirepressor-like protein